MVFSTSQDLPQVRNLKLLVEALESEVYSDVEAYTVKDDYVPPLADYDEVFEDDE